MKILLVTFDKEMEKKIRELLKDHQIITAKNGEEALLLNIADDVDLVIYDALAGGIAEDDINKLYEEGFQHVPFIILMDDLFPIDPNNIKPKVKKIISREVEVDKLPQLVEELAGKKEAVQTTPAETTASTPSPEAEEEEISWDALMGTAVTSPSKEEKAAEGSTVFQSEAREGVETTPQGTPEISLKKQCLLVSFDMPLVERIEKLIGDKCDLHIARSAKQALQKYEDKPFDIIIFDTISGVFAEKGIRDLYEKGGYKDSLYVLLLDEFLPIDIDKLPVKNLRAIKRESELELLPEIVEQAPHITFDKMIEQAATASEGISLAGKEETPAASEQQETAEAAPKLEEEITFPVEEAEKGEAQAPPAAPAVQQPAAAQPQPTGAPSPSQAAPAVSAQEQPTAPPPTATPAAAPTVQIDEKLIEKLVEQKINEKVIPLVEELIRSRLSEVYIKALVREIIEPQIDETLIKEIVREIAEPLVKEALEQLLAEE